MASDTPGGPQGKAGWLTPVVAIAVLATALRVVLLAFNRTDLFVDEAQYWLWGRTPDWGYYSKPPMIAWVIGAVTGLAGSDAPFWIRLPAPLFHGVTAVLLAALAARLIGATAAIWTAAIYVTLPAVALGSLLISTDTIMAPFLVGALIAWAAAVRRESLGMALLAGALLGLAALSKYAALFYLPCAGIAAIRQDWRPSPAQAAAALASLLAVLAPNIVWNLTHGLATLSHTADNAGWAVRGVAGNIAGAVEFSAAQFAVVGPVVAVAWLVALVRLRDAGARLLAAFSWPILAAFVVQAYLSKAYANWAMAGWFPGTALAAAWLSRRPGWGAAALAVNLCLAVLLPLATVFPDRVPGPGGRPLAERYLGRAALSRALIDAAQAEGAGGIVAANRDVLADLFHTGRDSGLVFRAPPAKDRPRHHYQMNHPVSPDDPGPLLFVSARDLPPCEAQPAGQIEGTGAWSGGTFRLWLVPPTCWVQATE